MRGLAPFLLLAGAGFAPAQRPPADEGFWLWLVERLESPDDEARENAFQSLLKEGEGAAARVLEGFETASPRARLLRARVVRRTGDSSVLEAVRARLSDPDPEVRREWADFLGRAELPRATVRERVADLDRLARDFDPEVARSAFESLRRLDHPESARVLASLAGSRDPGLRRAAARALAEMPSGRGHLLDLALRVEVEDPALLFELLPRLGAALAALEGKGTLPAPEPALSLFGRHWVDADPEVRSSAWRGFSAWVGGLTALRLPEPATSHLEWMEANGGDSLPLLDALVIQHLYVTRDDAAAVRWIERLRRAALVEGGIVGRAAAARAHLFQGLLDLLAGRAAAADAAFCRSSEVLERARRDDPAVGPARGGQPEGALGLLEMRRRLGGEASYAWRAVRLHALRAVNAMLHPDVAGLRTPEEEFRAALERLRDEAAEGREGKLPLDPVLTDRTGPIDVLTDLLVPRGRAAEAGAVFREMAALLSRLRPAEFLFVGKGEGKGEPPDGPPEPSFPQVEPSELPILLADFEERVLGDRPEALRILERLIEIQRRHGSLGVLHLRVALERRGGLLMRLRRGDEAKESLLSAARILETLRDRAASQGLLDEEAQRNEQLAGLFSTLAVNENVVRGDREASIAYRKKALELEPSDFHRLLFACQLARDGKAEEAREAIAEVVPGPGINYNLACVHALLGDVETAFEYLRRDFEEKRSGGESWEADREWAWSDPDLKGLRADARFREIVGEPSAPKGP
ncbi:MAG TPA: HEAT repeat domain-containing protein [Planctomycetota bacterium]|nr:HEAT repeat domain-containing protein [Planctomycetota bacterium]